MSKDIIINGVNVAGCSYYSSETYPYTCEVWDNECEAQNCYYKQLTRLQAENEENMKRLRELSKEECELREGWHTQCEVIEALRKENEQFKKAFEEIKEIAKENMSCEGENNPCPQSQDILDKINEVLK